MGAYDDLINDTVSTVSEKETDLTSKTESQSRHKKHGGSRPRSRNNNTSDTENMHQRREAEPFLKLDTDNATMQIHQQEEPELLLRMDAGDITAQIHQQEAPLIRVGEDNQEDYRKSIKEVISSDQKRSSSRNDSPDGFQRPSEAAAYTDSLKDKDSTGKRSLIRTTASVLGREVERTLENREGYNDITDRAKSQASRYIYRAGRDGIKGTAKISRGIYRNAIYRKKLSADYKNGALTPKEIRKALKIQKAQNIKGSISFLGETIGDNAIKSVEDVNGSDDFATQSITKPKDSVVRTRQTIRVMKSAAYTTKKSIRKVKAIYAAAKNSVSKILLLKGAGTLIIVAVLIIAVFNIILAVSSLFPVLSLKSEDDDLSETYLYITKLDAKMEEKIYNEDQKIHVPPIDKYVYFLNNREVLKYQIEILTDTDSLLNYFDSKYEDFSFGKIKSEIEDIHSSLYTISKVERREVEDGVITRFLDIKVTSQTWEEYYNLNKNDLLTKDRQDEYETLKEMGVYTFRQEISSPFLGRNWHTSISSRWGWRVHPITGNLSNHAGVDIAMPGGTPINAANNGTAKVMYDEDGYGKYVEIIMENGDYTLYGHMSAVAVVNGQQVTTGDVIGYVGSTGASTGNHLHFEYHKNNQNMCPVIFTECES